MNQQSPAPKPLSIFSLARLRRECFLAPISVDFTPIPRPHQPAEQILPKFNLDKLFYTPAFVNPYEQTRAVPPPCGSQGKEKERFLRKVEANLSPPEQEDIEFNPRDDLFCSMCQMGFRGYWAHVNSKPHLRNIRASRANKYIHELCHSYGQFASGRVLHSPPCPKQKKICKTAKKPIQYSKPVPASKEVPYNKEDFIIRFPKEFFSNERMNLNISTKGGASLAEKE